ncbi:MAG: HIT domain-containing protein [Actinobacteria bacterium]|nr:HIT domain-containing protein [Actinomycetota bacterium]
MGIERMWAGWRSTYVREVVADGGDLAVDGCVMCRLSGASDDDSAFVVARGTHTFVVLNAFPYTSGHLMVVPDRHEGSLELLSPAESAEVMGLTQWATAALKRAYRPDGINVGINLGAAAGAGVPGHLHVHVLPRWSADTNFMTAVADTRVIPESLEETLERLRAAWDG